jgi:glycosyltransferase involved in cell wall biosynthesis
MKRMTPTNPLVSIGMPVYNGACYLSEALDCISAQTFGNFELIISDNASTDATPDICMELAKNDARVRYSRSEINKGAAWNYNQVFSKARGKYFRWFAHDDRCTLDYLEKIVGVFESASDSIVGIYPQTQWLDECGHPIPVKEKKFELSAPSAPQRMLSFFRDIEYCNPVFGMIRTEALKKTRLIQPFSYSDKVLLVELLLQGKLHEYNEPLFCRRKHEKSSCEANKHPRARAAWFDPVNDRKTVAFMPENTLFRGYFSSIKNSELSMAGKMECLRILMREYKRAELIRTIREEWREYIVVCLNNHLPFVRRVYKALKTGKTHAAKTQRTQGSVKYY